jgi:broad specificity phosphatase PhoE
MYLLLIRHGETAWNLEGRIQGRLDPPLNSRGIDQSEKLAERLMLEEQIDVLYSSPLARARRTADIIGSKCERVPVLDNRLVERSAGKVEGMTLAEVKEHFPDVFIAWREEKGRVPLPGGEDPLQFQRRVAAFLESLHARHEDQRIAVVTHGGTLGMLLATLIQLDIQDRFPFRFDNASLCKVEMTRGRPRLDLLNDTCHLHTSRTGIHAIPIRPQVREVETTTIAPALSNSLLTSSLETE